VTQQREIRRVLGYTASDELVFVFGDSTSLAAAFRK
jgi:hypothetical protein